MLDNLPSIPATTIPDALEIRALEERDREGYSNCPESLEESLAWEAEVVWPDLTE